MFNPFVKFHKAMIPGFIEQKRIYLVSQTNKQALTPLQLETKTPILLSDYQEYNTAKVHYNAITNDKYRAILDLTKEQHRNKLLEMLSPQSAYELYAAFIENEKVIKNMLDTKYSENIRRYVAGQTTWRIERNETLRPNLELIFGELFVILKWSGQTVKLRLADVAKY